MATGRTRPAFSDPLRGLCASGDPDSRRAAPSDQARAVGGHGRRRPSPPVLSAAFAAAAARRPASSRTRSSRASSMPARRMPAILPGSYTVDETYDVVSAAPEDAKDAVRFRRGWFLGDGTGAGKGRQVAAIILDNWLRPAPAKAGPTPRAVDLQIRQADRGRRARLDRDRRLPLRHRAAVALSPGRCDRARRRASSSPLTRPCAPRRAVRSPAACSRSSTGSAATSTASSCSTRPTPWPTPPATKGETRRKETVAAGPGRAAPAKRVARRAHPLRLGDRRHDGAEPRLCGSARPVGHR